MSQSAPSPKLLRVLVIFLVLPLLQTVIWQDMFLPPMSKLKSHGIGVWDINIIVAVFAVIDLGLLLQYFQSKKTRYLVIDFIVFFLMMLACAGVTHLKKQQVPSAVQLYVSDPINIK